MVTDDDAPPGPPPASTVDEPKEVRPSPVSKTALTLRRYLTDEPHGVGCTIVLRGFPEVIVGALSRTREGGLCLSCKEGKKDGKDIVRRRYFDEEDVLSFEIWSVP